MIKLSTRKVTMLTDDEVSLVSGGGIDTMDSRRCGSDGCWSGGCWSDGCWSDGCNSDLCMSWGECESDVCVSLGCESSDNSCYTMGCA